MIVSNDYELEFLVLYVTFLKENLVVTVSTTREIGLVIRAMRRDAGMTQVELASACGCSQRFISQVERGKQTAELGKVLDVLATLGITVSLTNRTSSHNARELVEQVESSVARQLERQVRKKSTLANYLGGDSHEH